MNERIIVWRRIIAHREGAMGWAYENKHKCNSRWAIWWHPWRLFGILLLLFVFLFWDFLFHQSTTSTLTPVISDYTYIYCRHKLLIVIVYLVPYKVGASPFPLNSTHLSFSAGQIFFLIPCSFCELRGKYFRLPPFFIFYTFRVKMRVY